MNLNRYALGGPSEAVEGFRCVFYELHTQRTPCASFEIHADPIFVPRRNGFAEDTKEDREASFLNTRDFRRVFPATRQTFSLPLLLKEMLFGGSSDKCVPCLMDIEDFQA